MNWFSPNYFNYQDIDKDNHPYLERLFVKSFLTCSFPGRNSGPRSCTKVYTTLSALATPCPLCDLLWLQQWAVSTERKNKHLQGPVEFDGLCSVGQTVGRAPGSVGEPSSSLGSLLATLQKQGEEANLAVKFCFQVCHSLGAGPGHAAGYSVRYGTHVVPRGWKAG